MLILTVQYYKENRLITEDQQIWPDFAPIIIILRKIIFQQKFGSYLETVIINTDLQKITFVPAISEVSYEISFVEKISPKIYHSPEKPKIRASWYEPKLLPWLVEHSCFDENRSTLKLLHSTNYFDFYQEIKDRFEKHLLMKNYSHFFIQRMFSAAAYLFTLWETYSPNVKFVEAYCDGGVLF